MSSPRLPVVLSPEARDDYESILIYSESTWGEHQAIVYRDALDRAIDRLALFPRMGRAREDVFPGCRVCRVRQHLLIYRIDADAVVIVRVLHVRQDIEREFEDFEG